MKDGTFDIEQAIALKPDVLLMNVDAKTATEEAGYIEKLAKVGIPLVYVDFREKPMENTEPSMRIMGKLIRQGNVAEDFIKFRADSIARHRRSGQEQPEEAVVVIVERAGGYSDDCCMSFGNENFGKMVEIAGGIGTWPRTSSPAPSARSIRNRSSPPIPIRSSSPAATGTSLCSRRRLGRRRLWCRSQGSAPQARSLTKRPAFAGVKAVKDGNVHAIWHQFYNNPYQFVAIQEIAKWLHPELFKDLDPEATLKELHARFLPLDYKPGYFVSVKDE
jgi:iron complex transport system substrate-binding protein